MVYIAGSPETMFIVRKMYKIYINYFRLAQCFNRRACKVYETNLQNEKSAYPLSYLEALGLSFTGFDGLFTKTLRPAAPTGDCNCLILAQ